MFDNYNVLSL